MSRLLVATRKGLFIHERGPAGWRCAEHLFAGDPVTITAEADQGRTLYAGLSLGHFGCKLHRSMDGGGSWQEVAAPTYPEKPEGHADVTPWTAHTLWSLTADTAGGLWCGTVPGGLFHSADKGESWCLNEALWNLPDRTKWMGGGYDWPGIHSISVRGTEITLGVSIGGVWRSEDGGTTWQPRSEGLRAAYMPPELARDHNSQDPHLMVRCREAPDHWWIQHHNGIFRSTDNCASWQEITDVLPSNFGFAVAVHPKNPDHAWFVPAHSDAIRIPVDGKMVVNHTGDAGRSFQTLDVGLPTQGAYDLVFRHGLAVDDSGECLAMGSSTGGLWTTENGGREWLMNGIRLPQIYSVQFVP